MTDNRCQRQGCRRSRFDPNRPGCSATCCLVIKMISQAEHLQHQLGDTAAVVAFADAAFDLNRALDAAFRSRAAIRRAATDAGFSDHDWSQLLRGEYGANKEMEMGATSE